MAATAISPPWLGLQARANEPTYKVRVQNLKKQKSRKNAKQGLSLPPPQGREEAWGSPLPVKALPRWLGVPADDMLRLDRRAISRRQKEKRGLPGQPGSPPSCEYFKVFESLSESFRVFQGLWKSFKMFPGLSEWQSWGQSPPLYDGDDGGNDGGGDEDDGGCLPSG